MILTEAKFITSSPTMDKSPPADCAEIAFLGRSNVGKSSLLNSLVNKKKLAKKSSTPGKTQLINFFGIKYLKNSTSYHCRFVDLPGFGYAKVSKSIKQEWNANLIYFLKNRSSIRLFIFLKDARHDNLKIDQNALELIDSILKPDQKILTIFTKIDKLNQKDRYKLMHDNSNSFFVSNLKKNGISQLNNSIFEYIYE
jgi:GTP-binding protein